MARRRLVDHRRRAAREVTTVALDGSEHAYACRSSEDEALDASEGVAAIRRLVGELPSDQAEILVLRVVAGLSVAEVAAITGKHAGAVRVAQHRALKLLAKP